MSKKIKSLVATFGPRGSSVHAWLCSMSPYGCCSSPSAFEVYHSLQSSSWQPAGSYIAICSFIRQCLGFSQHTSVFLLKGAVPDSPPLIPRTYSFSIPKAQTEIEKKSFWDLHLQPGICSNALLKYRSLCL